jgi:LacI family transcriptional regulator
VAEATDSGAAGTDAARAANADADSGLARARPRRSTLRDVAARAQVDPSIVSRVLAGEDWRVSAPTRERIDRAVKALNYVPHRMARGLRTGETLTLAVLLPHIGDPAYFNMMTGAMAAAAESNYVALFADTNDDTALELQEIDRLTGRVDGVVSAAARPGSPGIARIGASGTPVVLLNRRGDAGLPSVTGPDRAGAVLAVTHLTGLGHRRIAHLGGPLELDPSQRRREGYLAAMADTGLPVHADWLAESELTEDTAAAKAHALLGLPSRRRPTAVFASTLPSALGALREFRAQGVDVPGDISVVGFDDHPLADHLWAPLTTIRMPHVVMGQLAVRLLIQLIRREPVPAETVVEDPPVLVVRGSTGPVSAGR